MTAMAWWRSILNMKTLIFLFIWTFGLAALAADGDQTIRFATQAQVNSGTSKNTAVSPATLGNALATAARLPVGVESAAAWFNAASFSGNTNGAALNGAWPDLSGSGYNLTLVDGIFAQDKVFGCPAVGGNGSTTIASNLLFCAGRSGMNTNITIRIKFLDPENVTSKIILSFGLGASLGGYIFPWRAIPGQETGGGSILTSVSSGAFSISLPNNYGPHTYITRYNGTYVDLWIDQTAKKSLYTFGPLTGGFGATNGLFLFASPSLGYQSKSYISEVAIWTNALSDSQIAAINQQDYRDTYQNKPTITLIGTSKTAGQWASAGGDLAKLLSIRYPTWRIEMCGMGGLKAVQAGSNVVDNIINRPHGTPWIVVMEGFGPNETANQSAANVPALVQVIETNVVNMVNLININGGQVILWPGLPDSWSTNGYLTNLTTWYSNNWQTIGVKRFVNVTLDPTWGFRDAYTNATYYPDSNHPSSIVYTNMVLNYLAPSIDSLVNPLTGLSIVATNAPANGNALRYTSGTFYWGP